MDVFDPFDRQGEPTNPDGTPVTPGIRAPKIFARNPFFGDTRLIPATMMPSDTSFDSILAENGARLLQGQRDLVDSQKGMQSSYGQLMARALRGPGVRSEQAPAPVADAVVKPNWNALHFDP